MKIGLFGITFIVFLILKATAVIGWSWLWVTSPLWIGAAFNLLFLLVAGMVGVGISKAVKSTDRFLDFK